MVLLVGDRDRIECIADNVKLTHALVRDLDEVVQEVKLLGKHGEETSQMITQLKALCKRLREDVQELKEEKTKLKGMVESHDELIMETVLNCMGEDVEDEDEEEDDDDGGDTAAPLAVVPSHVPTSPAATHEVITVKVEDLVEMVPEQKGPVAHEVILIDAKPELMSPRLYRTLMIDREESPSRMMDDLDDLDNPTEADYDVDEWYLEDGSNDRD
jgi:hypothetical protein